MKSEKQGWNVTSKAKFKEHKRTLRDRKHGRIEAQQKVWKGALNLSPRKQ